VNRIYNQVVKEQLREDTQMIFLSGPRQVGKTTISYSVESLTSTFLYLNWDNLEHRASIVQGVSTLEAQLNLAHLVEKKPILVLDEIHKFELWKSFLKGLYDQLGRKVHIIVTGSSRLDIYKKGGDSLMGRYFSYRVHPFSVAEVLGQPSTINLVNTPRELATEQFNQLFEFGGFPDPFLKHNTRFSKRWQRLRFQQLFREDIREVSKIIDINRLELLAKLLVEQAASEMTYSSLAKKIRVSVDTVSRWVEVLESFYFCFLIRPWSKNVTRSLLKEPKMYLWDWALITDPGARAENFIASHLLKAVQFWTDTGLGDFGLYYLRDTEKREVDFIVTRNDKPWFLVEVKLSDNAGLNPNLHYFQKQIQAEHAFQVVINAPFVHQNCFEHQEPIIVPALTFLSQLV
jgi:predicted AAA+ superfamily ATPase